MHSCPSPRHWRWAGLWQVGCELHSNPYTEFSRNFFIEAKQKKKNRTLLEEHQAAGETVPDDLSAAAKQLADEGMVPHVLFIDRNEIARLLGQEPSGERLATTRDELFKLRVFEPLEKDSRLQLISLQSQEGFMVFVKASLVLGAMISSPFLFYFIWNFVAAGLYKHERKYIHVFLPISLGLFFAGSSIGLFCRDSLRARFSVLVQLPDGDQSDASN